MVEWKALSSMISCRLAILARVVALNDGNRVKKWYANEVQKLVERQRQTVGGWEILI